jgi:hypothetical protein
MVVDGRQATHDRRATMQITRTSIDRRLRRGAGYRRRLNASR